MTFASAVTERFFVQRWRFKPFCGYYFPFNSQTKFDMHSGYNPGSENPNQPAPPLTLDQTQAFLLLGSLGFAGVVLIALLIVMSGARKTPSPVSPDTALPKRSKKVRSISVSVDLECPEKFRVEKNMTHSYNLRSCQERYRTVSECVGPGGGLLGLTSQVGVGGGRLHPKYKFPFQKLPYDCKLKIFSFLSQTERGVAAQVCQDWYNLVQNSSLWSGVDLTLFPRCHKSHKECTKLCYVMYRDRIKRFMSYLETVRPVLKRFRLAVDIGDHEDGWLETLENFLDCARLHELEYLYFNWKETPCKPYWEAANLTWSTGDAKDLLHKHRYRTRLFANLFDRITASAANITQLIIPFEWSAKSLQALSRLSRLDCLVLEKYFVFQSLSQESLDQLFTSVPRLRNLILEVWTPSGRGLQFYAIRSASLHTLDISQCRGFYVNHMKLPAIEVFKVTRHPWNGPLTSTENVNIPCLYQVLRDGCPVLKQINEHMLRPEWRSVLYPELKVVFNSVCSCREHKSGWAM